MTPPVSCSLDVAAKLADFDRKARRGLASAALREWKRLAKAEPPADAGQDGGEPDA